MTGEHYSVIYLFHQSMDFMLSISNTFGIFVQFFFLCCRNGINQNFFLWASTIISLLRDDYSQYLGMDTLLVTHYLFYYELALGSRTLVYCFGYSPCVLYVIGNCYLFTKI